MNLEVVKEHFKNAKEVRCLCLGIVFDMNDITERGIHEFGSAYWFDRIQDRGDWSGHGLQYDSPGQAQELPKRK